MNASPAAAVLSGVRYRRRFDPATASEAPINAAKFESAPSRDIFPSNSAGAAEAPAVREPILLSLIAHPWLLFPVLLIGLTLVVEAGLRLRHASSSMDEERESLIESA